MRITVHPDTVDRVDPSAYAILWLGTEDRRWSREGHGRLDLPKWESLQRDSAGPLICGPAYTRALCLLDGLDLDGFAAHIFTGARSSTLSWLMQPRVGDR